MQYYKTHSIVEYAIIWAKAQENEERTMSLRLVWDNTESIVNYLTQCSPINIYIIYFPTTNHKISFQVSSIKKGLTSI